LRRCAHLDVVVTSREPLHVGGETTYAVPPMLLPGDDADLTALADTDAVELFVDRVQRADRDFSLDAHSAATIAAICRRVDGLPLAIELAAARARAMSLDAIAETLAHRLDVLAGGARTAPRRQQSVTDSVAWSYDLLDDAERRLLRRLSIFDASFAIDAVEAVCADAALPRHQVLPTLLALHEKSLVTATADRYALLATIHEFSRDQLAASDDDAEELRARHLAFLIDLAQRSEEGLAGPHHDTGLARLRAEEPNIEAVFDWAIAHDRQRGLALATELVDFALQSQNMLRGWRWVQRFLDDRSTADPTIAAAACFAVALTALFCGDMAIAAQGPAFVNEALERYEQLDDAIGAARSRALLALMSLTIFPSADSRTQCEASVAELRAAGDAVWATMMLSSMGGLHVQRAQARIAMPYLEEARTEALLLGHPFLTTMNDWWRAGA
jgi:predicted ATPase